MQKASKVETLLQPLTLADVIARCRTGEWYVTHQRPERLSSLIHAPEFRDIDAALRVVRGLVGAYGPSPRGEVVNVQQLRPSQARKLFDLGATIVVVDADRYIPALRDLCAGMAAELGVRSEATSALALYSPPGASVILDRHFDPFDTIAVQLHGTKTWRVARNAEVRFPAHHFPLSEEELTDAAVAYLRGIAGAVPVGAMETVLMRPGSALLNPRGSWHWTGEISEEGSVSVSFVFHVETWSCVLREALGLMLLQEADWREPAMGLVGADPLDREARARLAPLLDRLRDRLSRMTADDLAEEYVKAIRSRRYKDYKSG